MDARLGLKEIAVIGGFVSTAVLATSGTPAQAVFAAGILIAGAAGVLGGGDGAEGRAGYDAEEFGRPLPKGPIAYHMYTG